MHTFLKMNFLFTFLYVFICFLLLPFNLNYPQHTVRTKKIRLQEISFIIRFIEKIYTYSVFV